MAWSFEEIDFVGMTSLISSIVHLHFVIHTVIQVTCQARGE